MVLDYTSWNRAAGKPGLQNSCPFSTRTTQSSEKCLLQELKMHTVGWKVANLTFALFTPTLLVLGSSVLLFQLTFLWFHLFPSSRSVGEGEFSSGFPRAPNVRPASWWVEISQDHTASFSRFVVSLHLYLSASVSKRRWWMRVKDPEWAIGSDSWTELANWGWASSKQKQQLTLLPSSLVIIYLKVENKFWWWQTYLSTWQLFNKCNKVRHCTGLLSDFASSCIQGFAESSFFRHW